ncbi:hypothetical protein D9611_006579 [Ephemerocybe angulata]|uniref:Uncharacterized protein n=1 Tax=Ephemerocybe angulata TaxID=980116 RepID=A0A8H5C7Y4_9AGAR|nr:hypothetical protein D9611_006579 [Tulosesus angulatus]
MLVIHDINSSHTQEKLAVLSGSEAESIKSLHLRPCTDAKSQGHTLRHKRSWGGITRLQSRKARDARARLSNLRNLSRLEHFDVQCDPTDDIDAFKQILPSLRLSWSGYSTSLRSLSLRIPLECYQGLFCSSLVLPRLSKLVIHVFASHHSTNPVDPMCSALVPFINRHTPSLESLSIVTPQTGTADLSPMFHKLKFFPRLTSISLAFCALSLECINLAGIQEFFSSHSYQLEDVYLHFNRMVGLKAENFRADIFFALPLFHVPLHCLKSLDIGFTGFRDATGFWTIAYAHHFTETLERLVLRHTQLSTTSLARLAEPFSQLRKLEVAVEQFTPTVLDVLSTSLPQLTELRLSFLGYSGDDSFYESFEDPSMTQDFCSEMGRRLYPGWNLRHLKTHIITPRTKDRSSPVLLAPNVDLCLRVLTSALPSVQTINGIRRSSLLQPERSRHWNVSVHDN